MGKQLYLILMLLFSIAIVALGNGVPVENWLQGKKKVTQLQLYVQDILSGPNPTNIQVASANSASMSPTSFGLVAVIDDPVRQDPNPESEIIGRAQGIFAFVSLEEVSLHFTFDLVFTSGEYNGSVLNIIGHNPYLREYRELSIVGGTGFFQLARGIIGVRTVSINTSTGDAFFQYNISVLHY